MELTYRVEERAVSFELDESLYPLDAIYGAAYIFVDRCFVFLTRPRDKFVDVRLRTRGEATEASLESLAGEFANELLNQVLRFRLAESTSKLREYYMARAFFTQPAHRSIDALLAELDAEEMDAGGIDIKVPWMEPTNG
jgi:His-Xaa-Ser system protein HxsD